jgi:hypothetical protein
MVAMIGLALVLVACGNDGEDDEPTAAPTEAAVATVAEPTTLAPSPSPAGTPDSASPAANASPAATPVELASPVSTPVEPGATPVATPMAATPEGLGANASIPGMQLLAGTVILPGTVNERFVISDDGCVGLGTYAGLQAGQQVIVRDEVGAIVAVAHLAATDSQVICSWTFEVDVPESAFYEVSIPMRAEHVYTRDEVINGGGQIELTLP